jgi:allantoinase
VTSSLSRDYCALVNTALYDHCPDLVAAFSQRGDELIGHGFSNATRQGELNETAERALLLACRDRMQQQNGKAPTGWLSPWISESRVTPDLLQETGYTYRLRYLRKALQHIAQARDVGDIWFTTPGAICQYVQTMPVVPI